MEFDPNKAFAEYLTNERKEITTALKGLISENYQKFTSSFNKYLEFSYKKYTVTKTLLYKDKSVDIDEIYVELVLTCMAEKVSTLNIIESISQSTRLIISATAGAGKSILAKKIFKSLNLRRKIIPIFIELRNLNNTDLSIIDLIVNNIKFQENISEEIIIYFLKKGSFCLILDGYDEIETSIKNRIDKEILTIGNKYEKTAIVITSRPDEDLEYLPEYSVYKVEALNKEQAIKLITKLSYDEKVKTKFINQLRDVLFEKHTDFLSIPLLLTIMLITFSETAEIPEKMHIFYEQAFDALYFRHDSSKAMYKREIKSKLSIDDFKKVLSVISLKSYMNSEINFSRTKLLENIRFAKKMLQIKFNNDNYIIDLLKSVCILIQDGQLMSYTHRSFQEYFAAYFITMNSTPKNVDILKRILVNKHTDNVINLSFEMNKELIERIFLIPLANEFLKKIKKIDNEIDLCKLCFKSIKVNYSTYTDNHEYYAEGVTKYWYFLKKYEWLYYKQFKVQSPKYTKTLSKKSFRAIFGDSCCERSKKFYEWKINVDQNDFEKLESLGIVAAHKKRVDFFMNTIDKIKIKHTYLLEDF